jgi:hypothetical protein
MTGAAAFPRPRFRTHGLETMKRWMKIGIVLAGYVLAFIANVAFVASYDRHFTAADNQTSGGMIAGAELIYGTGVFLLVALAPTLLALWFMRKSRPVWSWFTGFGLAFAILGLPAVLSTLAIREPPRAPLIMLASVMGVAQMLGSPLWIGGFALFAWLAPARDLRRRMLFATAIEVAVGACAVGHFLMRWRPF